MKVDFTVLCRSESSSHAGTASSAQENLAGPELSAAIRQKMGSSSQTQHENNSRGHEAAEIHELFMRSLGILNR